MTVTRTWFVSDLHLDLGLHEQAAAGAFAGLVEAVVLADPATERRLVLLGDAFELAQYRPPAGGREGLAAARLGALAARHQNVFEALRRCLEAGVRLDVVPGNHDVDLARPAVRERLRELLHDDRREAVRVRTWALHEPGAFHACHGHQHHDLNRFPTLLSAALDGPRGELPAPPLAAPKAAAAVTAAQRVAAVLRAGRDARRAEKVAAGTGYAQLLDAEAERLALPAAGVRELATITRFRWSGVAARLAVAVPGRRLGLVEADRYLLAAASRTHAVLSRHGCDVPFLVYGHTHRARKCLLPGTRTHYLNCGTWSSWVTGPDAQERARGRFPYVLVERDGNRDWLGELRYWRPGDDREHDAVPLVLTVTKPAP